MIRSADIKTNLTPPRPVGFITEPVILQWVFMHHNSYINRAIQEKFPDMKSKNTAETYRFRYNKGKLGKGSVRKLMQSFNISYKQIWQFVFLDEPTKR